MTTISKPVACVMLLGFVVGLAAEGWAAAAPTAEQALRLTPTQPNVDYAKPTAEQAAKCTISARKFDGKIGWVVEDEHGLTLRVFLDTNGDNVVDQWSYFKDGVEVYRDIDSDFNGKVDQCRWFHTAGTRWAEVKNEDGRITAWRQISAEEVTAEIVAALTTRNAERFALVVLKPHEVQSLGLGQQKAEELAKKVATLAEDFAKLVAREAPVDAKTQWVHFSASQPGVVPAGTNGSTRDLRVYENVVAIVDSGGKHGQVHIGTLIQVGDCWRAIDLPTLPGDAQASPVKSGFFFHASVSARAAGQPGMPNENVLKLLDKLAALDRTAAEAKTEAQRAEYTNQRVALLEQIAQQVDNPHDRAVWLRQLADMVISACQQGLYPDGPKRLETLAEQLLKKESDKELAAYVKFHQIMAEYAQAMQAPKADFAKIHTEWLKKLEQYVADYAGTATTGEAMLQLAMNQEYAAQEEEARKWYSRIIKEFPSSPVAQRATGALTRMDCVGKVIRISGKSTTGGTIDSAQLKGKVVVIHYWATVADSAKNDVAVLKDLQRRYGNALAVVGVNLDFDARAMNAFVAEHKITWPQIHEPGGMDSRPAVDMGILTLPTIILLDTQGKVVSNSLQVAELEGALKKLIR